MRECIKKGNNEKGAYKKMATGTEQESLIVIIPAYEPTADFVDYAKRVALRAKRLIVVNDGSNASYDDIFEEIAKTENVSYLTYSENHGKGYALKTAFRYCAEHFDKNDIVVTADCDGQHAVEDIFKVYREACAQPEKLILGCRDFDSSNVPTRNKKGNVITRRAFRALYGVKVTDTQTGLRGCSVATAERFLEIGGNRFEYEMNMLIFCKKQGIAMAETSIQTIYAKEKEDRQSHFRPWRDSLCVIGVLLKNLNYYMLSSVLSAVLDVFLFWLLSSVLFPSVSAVHTLIATITARVCSSVLNFVLNNKYVFNGKTKRAVFRYYTLWLCQLGASYGLVFLFGNVIGWNLTVTKAIGDLCLAVCSYQIQTYWVFDNTPSARKGFYGGTARFAKGCSRLFCKKYKSEVNKPSEPVVYVCRHLNMHGPITTFQWLDFDVHPMVFYPFFDEKTCYNQYAEYTFSVRQGKKAKKFNFKAWFASRFVPPLVRSFRAVPVYRTADKAMTTFKKATEYLLKGESLIVYPDVEYTSGKEHISEIYDGFLFLGQRYKRKTGKDLQFIPLIIDDEKRTITEEKGVCVNVYREEKDEAAAYLKKAINGVA